MKRFFVLLALLLALQGVAVAAPSQPDPAKNPVMGTLQKMGAKLYYLGNRYGMDGWFIIKDGQVQIAYATPDNRGALIGGLFGSEGDNVTAAQISSLVQANKEVADAVGAVQKEQMAKMSGAATAPPEPTVGGLPSTSVSPGEKLMQDLAASSNLVIGSPEAPEIIMIMDPRCPHCQATWKALHNFITKGSLHVRLVPIGAKDSDNERAAGMLLDAADPMKAWDKYMGGDTSALAGTPSQTSLLGVRSNYALTDTWHIEKTPYLVYRGKDGKIKVLQGEPKLSSLLADLGL